MYTMIRSKERRKKWICHSQLHQISELLLCKHGGYDPVIQVLYYSSAKSTVQGTTHMGHTGSCSLQVTCLITIRGYLKAYFLKQRSQLAYLSQIVIIYLPVPQKKQVK